MAKAGSVESVAAREHVAQKRPVSVHVIVTYDLKRMRNQIADILRMAGQCDEKVVDFVHHQLCKTALDDIALWRGELDDTERWIRAQMPKRPTPLRL